VLKRARSQVDVAMFYLRDDAIIDALCFLSSRKGVNVRILAATGMASSAQKPLLEKLAAYGVNVFVNDPANGKMHMKMAVIDEDIVITGCANWTSEAFERNIEDTLIIQSPQLARLYRTHIDALIEKTKENIEDPNYGDGETIQRVNFPEEREVKKQKRNSDKLMGLSSRRFSNVAVESFLLPDPDMLVILQQRLVNAKKSIEIGMYLLSNEDIITTLCSMAEKKQCRIRIWVNQGMLQARLMQNLQQLWDSGIDIQFYQEQRSILHLKIAVIDDRYVITGSANWTQHGLTRNIEDLLIFDAPNMAKYYQKYLDELIDHCHSFETRALNNGAIEIEKQDVKKSSGGYLIGLPSTGPRTDYQDIFKASPADAFSVNAHAKYLSDEEYLPVLLKLINTAHQSILIAMYVFPEQKRYAESQEAIISALERAVKRGVYVMLLLELPHSDNDRLSQHHPNRAERLREKGIDVRLDLPKVPLHTKMAVIDLSKVIIGSHNWSEGALTGSKVSESSALLILDKQEPRLMEYICSRKTISDMRSRAVWEQEISRLRALAGTSRSERSELIEQFTGTTDE